MDNVKVNDVNDLLWLKKRLSHVNESQIEFFLERTAIMIDGGMPPQQARAASLILLIDHMRL